jgi:hypothetical protein
MQHRAAAHFPLLTALLFTALSGGALKAGEAPQGGGDPPPGTKDRPATGKKESPRAPAALDPKPGLPVIETMGDRLQGPVRFPAAAGSSELSVGPLAVPLTDVLSIDFTRKIASAQEAFIVLRSGDEIFASIAGGDENELRLRAYAVGGGEIAVRLEDLRGIGFPRNYTDPSEGLARLRRMFAPGVAKDPAAAGEGGEKGASGEDRLHLKEGAELSGLVQKVDAETVRFQSGSAGEVSIALPKVRAVLISAIEGSRKGEEKGAGSRDALTVVVQYLDGSVISGKLSAIDPPAPDAVAESSALPGAGTGKDRAGALRLASKVLGEISSPLDRIARLSIRGGRCRFLSDIEPSKVVHKTDLFRPWEIGRDLSATGDPIAIRGRIYKKGLGMHSHTRADWDLGGLYARFQAVIAMDDRAKPDTVEKERAEAGIAVFRVHVDGRVVLEKKVSWSDPPLPVDIPIDGARTLGLELDHGPGFLVLDRGDWAEARIIKKN